MKKHTHATRKLSMNENRIKLMSAAAILALCRSTVYMDSNRRPANVMM